MSFNGAGDRIRGSRSRHSLIGRDTCHCIICKWEELVQRRSKGQPFSIVFLVAVLVATAAWAQESRWKELDTQIEQLQKQGKNNDALPVAQEALRIAEATFGTDHLNTATALNRLGFLYQNKANYAEAEPLYKRSLAIREKALGPDHLDVSQSLNDLAGLYWDQGKYAEAEPLYKLSLAIREKALGPDHLDVAKSLHNLAGLYRLEHKYAEAETLYNRSLAIREKALGPDNPDVAQSLNNLAGLYKDQGKYTEAEPLYQRSLAIREKSLGPYHLDVARSLNELARLYWDQGKYPEAEPLYQHSLAIREKVLGPDHPDVAQGLNDLAGLYFLQGKYPEAEPLYKRSLAIREKVLGPDHSDVAQSLNNLANLYWYEGNYAAAEPLYGRSLAIWEKARGPNHPIVAQILNNFAGLYRDQGRYAEAEPLYKRSLAILEKAQGPDHPNVAKILNNLANLYLLQGRYAEAELLYKRSLAIREKSLGPDHPDVATSVGNIGEVYREQGKYAEAEPLYKRSLTIYEKALGPEHPEVAHSLTNLAELYTLQGKYAEAEPLYKRSLAIQEKALGPDHPQVATTLNALAVLYQDQGKYAEAEPLFKRGLTIYEKALGLDHPLVGASLSGLAELYWSQGKYTDAELFFERDLQNVSRQFEYGFSYMGEKDRLEFLEEAQSTFPQYFSFCFSYSEQDPTLVGKMYDVLLWEKGLVGTSIAALRARVAATVDAQGVKLFEALTAKKTESARLATSRPDGWREARSRVDDEANELDQQLARRVSSVAEQKSLAHANWHDVQKALAPKDAAVEFVKFQLHDGKKWTDKAYYVALVVRPGSEQPALVQLGEAHQIEGQAFSAYRDEVENRSPKESAHAPPTTATPWRRLYDTVWKPLEVSLGDAKRVYVSLDGALNETPLGILQRADGRRVMEKYDVRVVSSTRDVLRPRHSATSNTAILVGNPRFLLSNEEQRTAVNKLRGPEKQEQASLVVPVVLPSSSATGTLSRDLAKRGMCNPPPPEGGVLCPLPGTATEIQSIGELLHGKNWIVSSYQGETALEEVVKRAASPRVLHLATHGFFLPDQPVAPGKSLSAESSSGLEDPMLRSGLFFAGADRMLKSELPVEGVENGVLTAYEASTLNLQGTELVVLSACETGRGHAQNGEGVFGLRRALQEAGAEAILMSLWSVPDRETQELMTLFYQNWLGGMEKPEALRRAEMKERDRVKSRYGKDLPYYWGAFILVGR
jgi:tetratricopeptide (TPR) repeat protein